MKHFYFYFFVLCSLPKCFFFSCLSSNAPHVVYNFIGKHLQTDMRFTPKIWLRAQIINWSIVYLTLKCDLRALHCHFPRLDISYSMRARTTTSTCECNHRKENILGCSNCYELMITFVLEVMTTDPLVKSIGYTRDRRLHLL